VSAPDRRRVGEFLAANSLVLELPRSGLPVDVEGALLGHRRHSLFIDPFGDQLEAIRRGIVTESDVVCPLLNVVLAADRSLRP
jgi:hypothetical protein